MAMQVINSIIDFNEHLIPPPWPPNRLPRSRDPRPRCVLLIGDGFTQGFLRATGLTEKIRCCTEDLIPPPTGTKYVPTQNDPLSGNLWDPGKWPVLFKFWRDKGQPSGSEFFEALHDQEPINPSVKKKTWNFNTRSLGYELRAFLWHLFRGFEDQYLELGREKGIDIGTWEWNLPLYVVISEFVFDVVSFNYDCWFDGVLQRGYKAAVHHLVNPLPVPLDTLESGTTFLVKPHGSIQYNFYAYRPEIPFHPNMWLQDYYMRASLIVNRLTTHGYTPREVSDKSLIYFPTVPDLVPPGRQGDDVCSPASLYLGQHYPRELLGKAKIVIACGLSGRPPDTEEVRKMLEVVRNDALKIQIGIADNGDTDTLVAKSLTGENYFFLEPNQLDEMLRILKDYSLLQYDWTRPEQRLAELRGALNQRFQSAEAEKAKPGES